MDLIEHPIGLNSEIHHAIAERVAWHTALVINTVRQQTTLATGQTASWEAVGSGSACRWKGKRFVLTAKHVLEEASARDIRFFLRSTGAIDWGTRPSQPLIAQIVALEVEDVVRCQYEDLACIILGQNESGRHLEFADLPKDFGDVPPAGGGTLITGCPTDQSITVAEGYQQGTHWRAFALQPRGCWAVVVDDPPRYFPSSFDSAKHFLLRYDPAEEGALPHGFSGSGVWYRRRRVDSLWAADPVLAGVQVRWHGESKLMIAVRSEVVRQFLEESIR